MKDIRTVADLERLSKHVKRPHLSSDDRVTEHAREQSDGFRSKAGDILAKAEREQRKVYPGEQSEIDQHLAASEIWEGRYLDGKKRQERSRTRANVTREPSIYRPAEQGGTYSYFADRWKAKRSDSEAQGRLERNDKESASQLRSWNYKREQESRTRAEEMGVTFETRVTPSVIQGFGGTFAPPAYLIQQYTTAPRPELVVGELCQKYVLPSGIQSISIPRIKTPGTSVQPTTDAAPSPLRDFTDSQVTSQVITLSGTVDVAIQLLEQSPQGAGHLDRIIFGDLASAFSAELESQLQNGLGGTKEFTGLQNVEGKNEITYTSSSPTGSEFFKPLAQTFGSVSDSRKLSPTCWVMRGGRWAFLMSALDKEERPLGVPMDNTTSTTSQPIGVLLGLPVYLSESIPTTLGAGQNQDLLYALRPADMHLWESDYRLSVYEEVLSGTMDARIQLRGYCAALVGRYPTSIATLTGTGCKVETNE